MENFEFYSKKAFYRANKKSKESFYMKGSISRINSYIQNFKKENPNFNIEDLNNILDKDFIQICDTVFASSHVYDSCIDFQCCKFLMNNKDKFTSILEILEKPDTEVPEYYGDDFDENLLIFSNAMMDDYNYFISMFEGEAFERVKIDLVDPSISDKEKTKLCNSVCNNLSNPRYKKDFKQFVDCVKNGPSAYLKYYIEDIKLTLKDYLVDSLSLIGTVLDKHGFLENYPAKQEISNMNLGVTELTYSLDSSSSNNLGVRQMLSKEFLQRKDIETLLSLNIFWINRFAKELDTYAEGIFSCYQLNLFPKMLDGSFDINDINEQDLMTIFTKMNILYFPTCNFLNYARNNSDIVESIIIPDKNYYMMDTKLLIEHNKNTIGDSYSEYFKDYENTEIGNDISKDLELFWKLYTPIINCYETKDSNMLTALDLPTQSDLSFNWGIVLTDNYKEKLTHDKASINLWMDVEGLNLPLRCHIPKKTLTDFLMKSNGHTFFPIYKGSEDFDTINTKILLPLTKKQTSFLKEGKKTNFEEYYPKLKRFLKHSYSLYNPKEFKKSNPTTTYINLDNLELYSLDKNGEYIPLNPEPRDDSEFNFE